MILFPKQFMRKYGTPARAMIAEFGDDAYDRAVSRAESCARGSRERKHWRNVASAVRKAALG